MTIVLDPARVNNQTVREAERTSIREFVGSCSEQLSGRVLDYGCGKQPYRDIVEEAGGHYTGFDRVTFPASVARYNYGPIEPLVGRPPWNAILCNQVVQYVPLYGEIVEATYPDSECVDVPLYDFFGGLHSGLGGGGSIAREKYGDRWLILTYPTTWAEVEPDDLTRFTKLGMERMLRAVGFEIERHDQRAVIDLGGFRLPLGYGVLARA